jgi:hypothetical protein
MALSRPALIATGLAWRVVVASAICLLYFYAVTMPMDRWPLPQPTLRAVTFLDTPVGLVKWILPGSWRPGASIMFLGDSTYCFPAPFAVERSRYLRVGVPVWTVVLYGVWWVGTRFRVMRARHVGHVA